MKKYSFGWDDDAAVECQALNVFMEELISLCEHHGIGFELAGDGDSGWMHLVPLPFKKADFDIFPGSLEHYMGGIPWLDEAKKRYEKKRDELRQESNRILLIKKEMYERDEYERLKRKFGS